MSEREDETAPGSQSAECIGRSIRHNAVRVMALHADSKRSIQQLIRELSAEEQWPARVHVGVQALVIGATKFLNTIDFLLTHSLARGVFLRLGHTDRAAARLALYERRWLNTSIERLTLFYPDNTPQVWKMIHTAASLSLEEATERLDHVSRIGVLYSHPTFIVETLLNRMPEEEVVSLLKANNGPRTCFFRVNRLKASPADILSQIEQMGVQFQEDTDIPGVYRVITGRNTLINSSLFASGEILVQDKASVMAATAVEAQSGHLVWDACAAPGMKTQLLWEMMNRHGHVVATDLNMGRIRSAQARSMRLGCGDVEWMLADASTCPVRDADRILIDAPCTSTGIFQSHPSFKWRLNKRTLFDIMSVQHRILEGIVNGYKGRPETEIVYSTCSILPHEGESQIDSIASRHDIELLEPIIKGSPGYPGFRCSSKVRRLFPHLHGTNGFFIARFRVVD